MEESADAQACIVSVPDQFMDEYECVRLIVRTRDVVALVDKLSHETLGRVAYFAIDDLLCDFAALSTRELRGPVEVVLTEPARQFPRLYDLVPLLRTHGVRVSIAVQPGFLRALRVASALGFPVMLRVGQPAEEVMPELEKALEYYLHDRSVKSPIEFFHSVLIGLLDDEAASLWDVQEENPRYVLYVGDDGEPGLPPRIASRGGDFLEPRAPFDTEFLAAHADCKACPHLSICQGYFKWPDPNYSCVGVRRLFETLRNASVKLARDMAQSEGRPAGPHGT